MTLTLTSVALPLFQADGQTWCPACDHNAFLCLAHGEGHLTCTRAEGHRGPHVACSSDAAKHVLGQWEER